MSKEKHSFDALIIGGGLAGLVSSIALSRMGFSVAVLEQKEYPFHKVCGEYISNEVVPYLNALNIFPNQLHPTQINKFEISAPSGKLAGCTMQLGGFGISRYSFDAFLAEKAIENGVTLLTSTKAVELKFENNAHCVISSSGSLLESKVLIAAYGKRNKLNQTLHRKSAEKRSPYIGIKQHFKANFNDNLVALHNFKGGYCGLSKTDLNTVNVCYLTTKKVFEEHKDLSALQTNLLCTNPHLKKFFSKAEPFFEPLAISQINFGIHERVSKHVLFCGDAAGLIHPLCGNGMAMAIHAAKLVATSTAMFLNGTISREQMEQTYQTTWKKQFEARMRFGGYMQRMLEHDAILSASISLGKTFPNLLKRVITYTHGKPF